MTPYALWTLLGLGVMAVLATGTLGAVVLQGTWRTVAEGRVWLAFTKFVATSLIVYIVRATTSSLPWPLDPHQVIPCAGIYKDFGGCVSHYYYAVVIGILQLLAAIGSVLIPIMLLLLGWAAYVWLGKSAGPDWCYVTNRARISLQWQTWRRERVFMHALHSPHSPPPDPEGAAQV